MIVTLVCGLLGLVAGNAGDAAPDTLLLRQAEEAFRKAGGAAQPQAEEMYQRSAELLETLRRRGYENVDLYRNQGRAFYLSGDLPRAILAFRRGLQLQPGDRDLRNALAYTREQVMQGAERFGHAAGQYWPLWLPFPSPWLLLGFAFFAYASGSALVTRWVMTRKRRLLYASIAAGAVAILAGVALTVESERRRWQAAHALVVSAADDTVLRKGNGLSYPPRHAMPLARGAEASLLFRRGAWLQIQLAGGETGWIPRAAALLDE